MVSRYLLLFFSLFFWSVENLCPLVCSGSGTGFAWRYLLGTVKQGFAFTTRDAEYRLWQPAVLQSNLEFIYYLLPLRTVKLMISVWIQISITEMLGCKEGSCTPNSQTEMITAACGSTTPICNGPNSFETLLFAPRYWSLDCLFSSWRISNLSLRSVAQEIFATASGQLQHNFANWCQE